MVYPKLSSLPAYLHRIKALKAKALAQTDDAWTDKLSSAEKTIEEDIRRLNAPLGGLIQAQKVNAARAQARAQQARTADDLRFLRSLPIPAGCSSRLYTRFLFPNLPIVAAIAQEYKHDGQWQNVAWEPLLRMAFEGAANHLLRHAAQPTEAGHYFGCAIRQHLAALVLHATFAPGEMYHLTDKSSFWSNA